MRKRTTKKAAATRAQRTPCAHYQPNSTSRPQTATESKSHHNKSASSTNRQQQPQQHQQTETETEPQQKQTKRNTIKQTRVYTTNQAPEERPPNPAPKSRLKSARLQSCTRSTATCKTQQPFSRTSRLVSSKRTPETVGLLLSGSTAKRDMSQLIIFKSFIINYFELSSIYLIFMSVSLFSF